MPYLMKINFARKHILDSGIIIVDRCLLLLFYHLDFVFKCNLRTCNRSKRYLRFGFPSPCCFVNSSGNFAGKGREGMFDIELIVLLMICLTLDRTSAFVRTVLS